jgi:hypothetical protein
VSLRAAQIWFAAAVSTPESDPLPVGEDEAARRLTRGPRLSAGERLEVYRRAYHARLVECLADDYPALRAFLGQEPFEDLCRAYIAQHPSTEPSLNGFGRSMRDFCASRAALSAPRFTADLASLEWAIVEVIHAPSAEPLTLSDLTEVAPERWADARLRATPASRQLTFEYPVNAYFQGWRDAGETALPGPARSVAVVYRSGPTVWRMNLSDPMADLLSSLTNGETLGVALDRTVAAFENVSEDAASARVMAWFRDWVSSGLFIGVDFS